MSKIEITHKNKEQLSLEKNDSQTLLRNALEKTIISYADFKIIDHLLHVTGYDSIHLILLLITMFDYLKQGSVYFPLKQTNSENTFTLSDISWKDLYEHMHKNIEKYSKLIYLIDDNQLSSEEHFTFTTDSYKPIVAVKAQNSYNLYFQKYFAIELNLQNLLLERLNSETCIQHHELKKILANIIIENQPLINNKKIIYDEEQVLSTILPFLTPLTIISGGPGTGKTTIVCNIVRAFLEIGFEIEKIKIAAPTGRAAQRLKDSLIKQIESLDNNVGASKKIHAIGNYTLHRLLRFNKKDGSFFYSTNNPLPADVIIVDEVSMVDMFLMNALLESLSPQTHLILIGDGFQLPSIEAGAVISHLTVNRTSISLSDKAISLFEHITGKSSSYSSQNPTVLTDHMIILKKSYRSIDEISAAAEEVKNGKYDYLIQNKIMPDTDALHDTLLKKPIQFIDIELSNIQHVITQWFKLFYGTRKESAYFTLIKKTNTYTFSAQTDIQFIQLFQEIYNLITQSVILSPIKNGQAGTNHINRFIIQKYIHLFDSDGLPEKFAGLPILITKNDHSKNLYNGDIGFIIKDNENHYYGVFKTPESFMVYPVGYLPQYEPAYAITIHKSQGSEYEHVLLLFPNIQRESHLTREILYTAITRAKKTLLLVSSIQTVSQSVKNSLSKESRLLNTL